jgi:hypothetical protein
MWNAQIVIIKIQQKFSGIGPLTVNHSVECLGVI